MFPNLSKLPPLGGESPAGDENELGTALGAALGISRCGGPPQFP